MGQQPILDGAPDARSGNPLTLIDPGPGLLHDKLAIAVEFELDVHRERRIAVRRIDLAKMILDCFE